MIPVQYSMIMVWDFLPPNRMYPPNRIYPPCNAVSRQVLSVSLPIVSGGQSKIPLMEDFLITAGKFSSSVGGFPLYRQERVLFAGGLYPLCVGLYPLWASVLIGVYILYGFLIPVGLSYKGF